MATQASSRRTLDVDVITLRQVFIRGSNNSNIPSTSVLVSDGQGGTYWSLISTVGTYPSFNQLVFDSNTYTATANSTVFQFKAGPGIGFQDGGPGTANTSYIYAKAFQSLAVPGLSTIQSFTSNVVTSNLTFSSLGGLHLSTDTTNNIVWFNAGIKNVNVLSNTSTLQGPLTQISTQILPITLGFSTLQLQGVGDIVLSTDAPTNSVFFSIRGYTASAFYDLSANIYSYTSNIWSTASTTLVSKIEFSTGLSNLETSIANSYIDFSTLAQFELISTTTVSTLGGYSSTVGTELSSLSTSIYTYLSTLSTSTFESISTLSSYFTQVNQSTISSFIYSQLTSTVQGWSSLFTSSIGPFYSTLSSAQSGGISTTELFSTTSSLLQLASSITAATYQSTVSYISTLSTTMTSSFLELFAPKINIVSSIGYTGTRGDSIPFFYVIAPTYDVVVSTATLNFKDVVSSIHTGRATVTVDYNPVILYPMSSSNTVPPQQHITYFQYADGTNFSSIGYEEYVNMNQSMPGATAGLYVSNVYSRNIRLTLSTGFLLKNGLSNYTIYHRFPTLSQNLCNLGPSESSTVHIRTPLTNSLFLNIFNQD